MEGTGYGYSSMNFAFVSATVVSVGVNGGGVGSGWESVLVFCHIILHWNDEDALWQRARRRDRLAGARARAGSAARGARQPGFIPSSSSSSSRSNTNTGHGQRETQMG